MRLALIGANSFIARHVRDAAKLAGIDVLSLPHNTDLDRTIRDCNTVINFALSPDFKNSPYSEEIDLDARAAAAAGRHGARFIMLSTRRVYPASQRWNAKEDATADGDETVYGQNKAAGEHRVTAVLGESCTILRLSNIVGFEYGQDHTRKTFMATALQRLKAKGEIAFDMAPTTERDFLPVEVCAAAIVRSAQSGEPGVFNLGSGFAAPCGDIAAAVMKGFGSGKLVVTNNQLRDAFYLNMDRWNSKFSPLISFADLMAYCEKLGRRLRDA